MPSYIERPKKPMFGNCEECHTRLTPKKSANNPEEPEWYCHVCGGGRHFCDNAHCWFLIELMLHTCNDEHYRFIELACWGSRATLMLNPIYE